MNEKIRNIWDGRYGRGAMADRRRLRREQAEERNARTRPKRTRRARLEKIRKGKIVPHPDSRDARVKIPRQK